MRQTLMERMHRGLVEIKWSMAAYELAIHAERIGLDVGFWDE